MENLRTDFVDDILNTSENTRRKFRMITNDDGTISLEDVTAYSQVGDSFGAAEVNKTNGAVNALNESLNTIEEITITSVANDYATFMNNINDHAYVKNGVCYLDIGITGKGTYSGWADIAKLPVKPATNVDEYTPCVDWVNNYNTLLRVISDGSIAIIARGNATSAYRARMTFPCVKVE